MATPGLIPRPEIPKPIDPKDSTKVRVTVSRCNSKFFYVHGEVWSPGRFPFTGSEKILDAIKAAEGMNEAADREKIYLYRGIPHGEPERLMFDLNRPQPGQLRSANDSLKPGDRLVVLRRAGGNGGAAAASHSPLPTDSQSRCPD